MDLHLIKRLRELAVASSSTNEADFERELEQHLTYAEQRTSLRLSTKRKGGSAHAFINASMDEEYDGRGGHYTSLSPVSDPRPTGPTFNFCRVCAEFDPQNALLLFQFPDDASKKAGRSNAFVSMDGGCQIMATLPTIMRSKRETNCRSCIAIHAGIRSLYDVPDMDIENSPAAIDYDDEDIEVTIIFKRDNVLRLYLSRRSTGCAVESPGMSFFALPMLEYYSKPGQPRMFPVIGSNMTKLYPEYPDSSIPGGQAKAVSLAAYSSKGSYLSMQKWLQECMQFHPTCNAARQSRGQRLPKRVLDVGRYDSEPGSKYDRCDPVCIYESHGEQATYIALSHCWGARGNKSILKCTKATIQEFKRWIDWERLPKTFQNAIHITRLLGIRYLWIDSLCIIQDSANDWAEQCEQMSAVYACALLTISATASHDSSGGCFHEALRVVEWEYENKSGEPAVLCIRQAHDHSAFGERRARNIVRTREGYRSEMPMLPAPVFQRAWCHQERLLGIRILHYADTELVYECLTGTNCECGALENWQLDDAIIPRRAMSASPESTGFLNMPQPSVPLPRIWQDVVESYSSKYLTFDTDKLPAIAGLAKRFQHYGMKAYHAGIFEAGSSNEYLIQSLLWTSSSPEMDRRSSSYVAPSWSWASVLWQVSFPDDSTGFDGLKSNDYLARILKIESLPENAFNPFGRVKSGLLKVEGWMSSGSIMIDPGDDFSLDFLLFGEEFIHKTDPFPCYQPYDADCYVESTQLAKRGKTVACIWLCTTRSRADSRKMGYLFGLVIIKVKGTNTWRRVGRCKSFDIKRLPEESHPRPRTMEWQQITIV